jgi:hypothetical protein
MHRGCTREVLAVAVSRDVDETEGSEAYWYCPVQRQLACPHTPDTPDHED